MTDFHSDKFKSNVLGEIYGLQNFQIPGLPRLPDSGISRCPDRRGVVGQGTDGQVSRQTYARADGRTSEPTDGRSHGRTGVRATGGQNRRSGCFPRPCENPPVMQALWPGVLENVCFPLFQALARYASFLLFDVRSMLC